MRMLVLPLTLFAAVALATEIKVAIEIDSASTGRIPPNACYRIDSLCKAQGWEDSIVTGSDIDEASELAEYDVVVTGDRGYADNDFQTYQSALKDWVRSGGGFVGLGWIVYGVYRASAWQMDSILPVSCSLDYNFFASGRILVTDSTHPVTLNVHDFDIQSHGEWANAGLQPGATALGGYSEDTTGQASIAVREVGAGRSVYLGPIYFGDFQNYENEPYYDDADAMLLLKQAIEWAASPDSTGVDDSRQTPGPGVELREAIPSPFRFRTRVSYDLAVAGRASLVVYDLAGKAVRTLLSGNQPAGAGQAAWDRTDYSGLVVPSGVYFVRLHAGGASLSLKLVVR